MLGTLEDADAVEQPSTPTASRLEDQDDGEAQKSAEHAAVDNPLGGVSDDLEFGAQEKAAEQTDKAPAENVRVDHFLSIQHALCQVAMFVTNLRMKISHAHVLSTCHCSHSAG